MSGAGWNPEQYHRFQRERRQPFDDLIAMVEGVPGPRVVDLGCGTGELTREVHESLAASETVGIDSSPEMLSKAPASERPGLRFERGDLGAFAADAPFDIVFSNAAIHWVDDHAALLARLAGLLAPGGQLAIQVPANHDHPSHTAAAAVAAEEPFATALGGHIRRSPVLAPEQYAAILHRLGFAQQRVFLRVYAHLLPERADVIEWVKGTTLTDYQKRLPPAVYAEFLARYRERLLPELEDTRPFFFAFKRVLMWARR